MNKKNVLPVVLVAAVIILSIIALSFLPQEVELIFISRRYRHTSMPKSLAILFPFIFGVGGAVVAFIKKDDERLRFRGIVTSCTAIAMFLVMFLLNAF